MTTEEKLEHFYDFSMESAKKEAQNMLNEYKVGLDNIFKDHQTMKNRQAKIKLDDETSKLKRDMNKALSSKQIEIKRTLSKKQSEIKELIFTKVQEDLLRFKKKPEYQSYLCKKMKEAWDFAAGDDMVIYIDPSDAALAKALEKETGIAPTISKEEFLGGMRAVIASKNILVDNSFASFMQEQKERFTLDGGMIHE